MKVPFVNLSAQYQQLQKEITASMEEVFRAGQFVGGAAVSDFEKRFGEMHRVRHCIATGNCTDAIYGTLKSLGTTVGNEIIVPAFGWISCAAMASLAGATPIFADVHSEYYTINPADVLRKITSSTKGIVAIHLFGQAAPVLELKKICDAHNLFMIEDCAQGHLSSDSNQLAGSVGEFGCFSFYPTKNLGSYGDAGCALTNDDELANRFRRFVNHGGLHKNEHLFEGINSRMDTLQAALLNVKLNYLEQWTAARIAIANQYKSRLRGINGLELPVVRPDSVHTFHLFVIRTPKRDELMRFLLSQGIEAAIHYPSALPFEPAYASRHFKKGDYPVSAVLQEQVLTLPLYPELEQDQIDYVCREVSAFFNQ